MKTLNIQDKFGNFFSLLKERNLISHSSQASDKKDNKYLPFDFKVKYFLIFDKNGLLLINSTISEFTKLSEKFLDKIKIIVMKLGYSNIQNFEAFFMHLKIYFYNDNFIYVCLTSYKSNTCLVRLYLYFLNIVYINLIGDNLKNSACLINISKIFEVYFVLTLTSKFCKVMEYILSNKEKNSCKYLYKFKSLLIYYAHKNINIPIFDYRKISYRKELQYKYSIRKNDVLFNTMKNLIIGPIYKNNYIEQNTIYSHELDLYSTFPRWIIFGKYFKIYNGLNIIEIFTAKKLSKITASYKEFEIKTQKNINNYYKVASRHSHKFIKLMELFTFNYLEVISNVVGKYNNPKNELLYFDLDLLIVTNDVISLKLTEEALVNLVYKRLQLYLINKIKFADRRNSILLEEKNENSNSNSNTNNDSINKDINNIEEDEESQYSISTISKSFLQVDSSDIFEEIYQKRKSLQLSSFESIDPMINQSEISEPFQNISFIRNLNNNNNNDAYSLLSYKPNDSKKRISGIDIFSILDKQGGVDESINVSKLPTEKQINLLRERRSSIPTFNIIVNNNNTNNNIPKLNKRMSFRSLKGIKKSIYDIRTKSLVNNILVSKKKERSNSFTESGLFLKQFYSMMNNTKFFKNKHHLLKEIQKKIASIKRNNSLKDLQSELKLKNNSPFYKSNMQNGKNNDDEKTKILNSNESKVSEHNIQIIKNSSTILHEEFENSINKDNGGEIIHEYYGDKSSSNLFQKNDSLFKKLNNKY